MRLIDADKLENDIRKVIRNRHSKRITLALYMMLDIIRGINTIAVIPVKHGKWIKRFGNRYMFSIYDCSECKCPNPTKTEYCPNCGAKMDRR